MFTNLYNPPIISDLFYHARLTKHLSGENNEKRTNHTYQSEDLETAASRRLHVMGKFQLLKMFKCFN